MQTILSEQFASEICGCPEIITSLKTHEVVFTGLSHDEEYFPIIARTETRSLCREPPSQSLRPDLLVPNSVVQNRASNCVVRSAVRVDPQPSPPLASIQEQMEEAEEEQGGYPQNFFVGYFRPSAESLGYALSTHSIQSISVDISTQRNWNPTISQNLNMLESSGLESISKEHEDFLGEAALHDVDGDVPSVAEETNHQPQSSPECSTADRDIAFRQQAVSQKVENLKTKANSSPKQSATALEDDLMGGS